MKNTFLLTLLLMLCGFLSAFAQTQVPLKFEKDLPRDLFSAPTGAIISYATNQEINAAEEQRLFNKYSTQLLTDNQQLGLQLIHVASNADLADPVRKKRLVKQYDSLKVENLLLLNITEIKMQGAQSSFVLLLTPYNQTPQLMTPRQRAYTLQAETYESLIRNFNDNINQYNAGFFKKGPGRDQEKANLATEPEPVSTAQPRPVKPNIYPTISLTIEDQDRRYGGTHRNFYYYVGANQQEKNAGFFGQHLRRDLSPSPAALKEMDKYRLYKMAYLAERLVFVTSVSLYGLEVIRGNTYSYFNDRQKVYVGLAIGSLLTNIYISRHTNQHLFRAIDEYNVFADSRNKTGFRRFKPDNFGLGFIGGPQVTPTLTLRWDLR